ncbi:sulfite oxidase-like oxidoreductase [Acidimicrobiia bacterium EGI L10123]|uniref:sulfite oxidase-like oxidoreductase n=1 Tax=Salinilacustrithrix flava TaxID=2957203 RepID=UPI003D7C15E5|nr:sulfite oxidase-like oxidoreductase [Acidimicrobiia bacterium EGI L10123]
MGFFDRNRKQLAARGIDPDRLPPGQYSTDRFPVLHVGDVPRYAEDLSDWDLRLTGLVRNPTTLSFDELRALPTVEETFDIHCVTKWSKFDTRWTGVRLTTLMELAGVQPEATHLIEHAEFGYTTNLPLADLRRDDVLVAWAFDGEPLEPEHGHPVRLVLPHRYFWKSAKWLRVLEFAAEDRPGFWERNGYHNDGDPFLEQRHWGD